MNLSRSFIPAASVLTAVVTGSSAPAQIMPGIVAPDSASTAMMIAQIMGCTMVAANRPSPFDSANIEGTIGLTFQEAAPEEMLEIAEMDGSDVLAFTVDNPEGEVWVMSDVQQNRCAVATLAGDLSLTENTMVSDYDGGMMGYRSVGSQSEGQNRYISQELGLAATVISSENGTQPLVVITERAR